MNNELLLIWSDHAGLSLSIWIAVLVTSFYLGRKQAHLMFKSTGKMLYSTFRLWEFGLKKLEEKLSQRNKVVLLECGKRAAEKSIEREFDRISNIVKKDLSKYPALHRQISESIEKIELDYQQSAEVSPLPPAWGEVVQTITALPTGTDPTVNKILINIKKAVEQSHQQTLKEYKKVSNESHRLLKDMQPDWRQVSQNLDVVGNKIAELDKCAKSIDSQIDSYQSMVGSQDSAVSSLASSSLTQFFISGLVLVIASLGGLINFQLIAMPMAEMVGGSSYIGELKTSDIAALVIILIEIAMGLFLFESLRITNLFPIISSMDDRMRRRMMYVTFAILAILATIEASLAYMRDLLALDREALQQSLINVGTSSGIVEAQFRWIPSVGQMIMGFILPFALAFIAIPLESFIHSLRVVLGYITLGLIRSLRVLVRMAGGFSKHFFKLMISLFDLLIAVPLGIERLFANRVQNTSSPAQSSSKL
ncbi:MAG: hypothetical protein KUG78_00590 [Kangiellaceae bacterium]|nr:hypothetical protein [Kangiellaceae bacterium]